MLLLLIFVAIWWISNAVTSIASKIEVGSGHGGNKTSAFKDMRWMMLTTLQFLLGSAVSVVWLKLVKGQTLHLNKEDKKKLLIVVLGNLIGHLSVNASYTFVSSSATQVIKSCEPIFMFLFLICLGNKSHRTGLTIPVFLSLLIMFLGTCLFVMWDITFNIWGVLAAVLSNIAFPLRNIFLKKLNHCFNSPLEQYLVLSLYGSLVLVPVTCAKLILSGDISLFGSKSGVVAVVFHYIYNIASITVLQAISPMNHAILNFTKRICVIIANIEYFNTTLTWQMSVGLVILVIGLTLYHFKAGHRNQMTFNPLKGIQKLLCLVGILSVLFTASSLAFLNITNNPLFTSRSLLPVRSNKMATSWVYLHPIPQEVVENIEAVHYQSYGRPIHVYCGTSQCTKAIQRLNNPNINANFLVIPDLVRNTSLERWVLRHPLNKILTGIHFEDHLQEVVRLAHHWHYGGLFFDPTVRMNNDQFPTKVEEWLTISQPVPENTQPAFLEISSFPPRHPFIKNLFDFFGSEYNNASFRKTVWNIYRKLCNTSRMCPTAIRVNLTKVARSDKTRIKNHFGTISYDSRVRRMRNANFGDEIQGFPGVQFLPYVDFFLDRERQTVPNQEDNFTIFFNAWWGDPTTRWPPPQNIYPIMVSVHIQKEIEHIVSKSAYFLKRHKPIGCRDLPTLDLLTKLGVDSFFSGCLTLLLQNMNVGQNSREGIYIVDVKTEFSTLLPSEIRKRAISLTHKEVFHLHGRQKKSDYLQGMTRFRKAYELIERYSQAKLVITQRIHCALPCVAMGIPVIFISSSKMPGGGGSSKIASSRVVGLTNLFHTLDMYNMSMDDAKRWLHNFNWSDPPRNPNMATLMKVRATFWNVIRENRVFHEAAHKFGMIPLTRREMPERSQLLFHLIFTVPKITLTPKEMTETFNWRHWRCVESIFHHHPFSKVIIHSNSLNQSTFDVLTEVGYDLEVEKYNLTTLAQNTPAEIIVKKGLKDNSIDLLPFLLLYRFGGVYLDSDLVVVRPLDDLKTNVLGLETNATVMKFEKSHPFLKGCLQRFGENVTNNWKSRAEKNGVEVVPRYLFYVFDFDKTQKECLEDTSGATFEAQMKIVKSISYVVHLRSTSSVGFGTGAGKLRDGTICKHLLNSYCVLCNKIY